MNSIPSVFDDRMLDTLVARADTQLIHSRPDAEMLAFTLGQAIRYLRAENAMLRRDIQNALALFDDNLLQELH